MRYHGVDLVEADPKYRHLPLEIGGNSVGGMRKPNSVVEKHSIPEPRILP